MIWQTGKPSADNGRIYSDLPVQIYDWDNDGANEVLYVRQAKYAEPPHDGRAVVVYMDIRAAGKGYEEFVRRAIEADGAEYIRGRVSRVYRRGDGNIGWIDPALPTGSDLPA